jgi:hypothetical protein
VSGVLDGISVSISLRIQEFFIIFLRKELRPVRMVPEYGKVVEVVVKQHLLDFSDKRFVTNGEQSGF